mmetsp:Transcript_35476/g.84007  ORF Transcript_35476/g.84007 Transcript_35476/m.84007 type:complete len:118 (+) Transcript_35476:3-356(+)
MGGYLENSPNQYEGLSPGDPGMGGYLENFPVDDSAATCGQGACNDETGCDDQAFMDCMKQLHQQKAVKLNKLRLQQAMQKRPVQQGRPMQAMRSMQARPMQAPHMQARPRLMRPMRK